MCTRLILQGRMYICEYCFDELKEYKDSWKNMTAGKVLKNIEHFMYQTSPGTFKSLDSKEDIEREFERLTFDDD